MYFSDFCFKIHKKFLINRKSEQSFLYSEPLSYPQNLYLTYFCPLEPPTQFRLVEGREFPDPFPHWEGNVDTCAMPPPISPPPTTTTFSTWVPLPGVPPCVGAAVATTLDRHTWRTHRRAECWSNESRHTLRNIFHTQTKIVHLGHTPKMIAASSFLEARFENDQILVHIYDIVKYYYIRSAQSPINSKTSVFRIWVL